MKAASIWPFFSASGAVAEGLVGRVDVLFGHAVDAEHVHRIEEHAGTGCADGDVLALEIRNGLDLGIRGDDLHLLGVEGRDGGEALNGARCRRRCSCLHRHRP